MKKFLVLFFLFSTIGCANLEFVLNENTSAERFKDKTKFIFEGKVEEKFTTELFSYFGNNTQDEFILITTFVENKDNIVVKKNQVAEKIDYEIVVKYEIYHKKINCQLYTNTVVSKFSFVPKSFGHNFAADRSFEGLYKNSVRKNILEFVALIPDGTNCLQ